MNFPFEGGSSDKYSKNYGGDKNLEIVDYGSPDNNISWCSDCGYDGRGAYEFDGIEASKYLTTGTLPLNDNFTFAAWVYPKGISNSGSGDATIFNIYYSDTDRFQLTRTINGPFQFYNDIANLGTAIDFSNTNALLNEWTHVVLTNVGNNWSIYVNGDYVESITTRGIESMNVVRDFYLGERKWTGGFPDYRYFWNGTIDDVLLLNGVLSAEQIQALYNNRTDLIVSQETLADDVWEVCVIPNDGYSDGNEVCSGTLTVTGPDIISPVVTLVSPVDNYLNTSEVINLTFDCNVTDDLGLTNISLYITNSSDEAFSLNQTTNVSGVSNSSNWILELGAGSYSWNCLGFDNSSNPSWGDSNRSLEVNYNAPTIDSIILNSTLGTNLTTENLTAYPINVTSINAKVIYDWKLNGSSIALLNMPMDGGLLAEGNTKVKDYSGQGYNASLSGSPIYDSTGGYDGKGAYVFDGDDDWINPNFNPNIFSISFWIKTNDLDNSHSIMGQRYDSVEESGNWQMSWKGDNLRVYAYDSGGGAPYLTTTNFSVSQWYHVAVTTDNSNLKFYVNGNLESENAYDTCLGCGSNDDNLRIGSSGENGIWEYFNGILDEVVVFNRTLSNEQILALYNNQTYLIVSQETFADDVWEVCVIPNDGYSDGNEVCSGTLTVTGPDIISPVVTLVSPVDNYLNTSEVINLTFDCNVTDDLGLTNISLYITNSSDEAFSLNQTTNVSGVSNSSNWILELGAGSYSWNCLGFDNSSNPSWGDSNRSLEVNYNAPTIDSIILNSTLGTNLTTENLTAYPINVTSINAKVIYDWKLNGSSIALLNMPMDGGLLAEGNTKVKDYSGQGYNASLSGSPIYDSTGGYDGKGAYVFDGDDDWINPNFNPNIFSISFWIKTNDLDNSHSIMGQRYDSVEESGNWQMSWKGDNLRVYAYDSGGGAPYLTTTNFSVSQWYHVAVTTDNSNLKFYVNGNLESENAYDTCLGCGSNDDNLRIGSSGENGIWEYFNGILDEVVVFNRTLSAEQISALYNNRTDLIVSQETLADDIWQACATPNDGIQDGNEVCSNNLTILGGSCSPTINQDWIISSLETCDGVNTDVGTGKIIINSGGSLTLTGCANFTADGLELNRQGDSVFVEQCSELRLG